MTEPIMCILASLPYGPLEFFFLAPPYSFEFSLLRPRGRYRLSSNCHGPFTLESQSARSSSFDFFARLPFCASFSSPPPSFVSVLVLRRDV